MRTNLMGYPKAPVKAAQTTGSKMTTSTGKINNKPPTQTNLKENVSGNQKPTHGARFADPDYMEPESKAYGRFTQEPPSYKQNVVPSQPSKVQPKPQSASQKGRNEPPVNSYFGQPEVQYGRNDRQIGSHMMQPEVQTSSRNNVAVKQSIIPNEVKKPQRPMSSKAPVQSSGRGPAFREPMVVPQNLEECRECGRKFNEKALAKHEKICKKVFSQKRKVFNSAKQRIVSKEQVQINKRVHNKYESSPQKRQQMMPKWKQYSLAFRMAMKQAKGHAPSMNEVKMMQQVNYSSQGMTLCKWCGRKFQHVTAYRHIPFCEKKAKEAALRKPSRR